MRPTFRPELVNPAFGDPGLFVDFLHERRAVLFDLGDLRALAPRKILRTTHVFVSHTHMDHFFGFDWLLRISLGRPNAIELFGPPGILAQVEAKLSAYTWNLVANYAGNFTLAVSELQPDGGIKRARYACRRCFAREPLPPGHSTDGVLVADASFLVRAAFLDHAVPVLGFALEEPAHVNVWRNRLEQMGLAVGPWLRGMKRAVLAGAADTTPIAASCTTADGTGQRTVTLGELRRALDIVPGSRIAYVTDVVHHEENVRRIVALAHDVDQLYIEAVFLDEDAIHAERKFHLTAKQAGRIARAAGARHVVPFHFSPRYKHREGELRAEVARAHHG